MKITDVRTVLLTGPCTDDPYLREARKLRSAAFVEIATDGPLTGIGETYAGYFCPETVPAIVDFFKPILVGQTVDDIPGLWNRMYQCGNFWCRVGLGPAVINGIEAVARLMADRGRRIATHAWGAGGSLMQNVHAGFAAPNTCMLEMPPAYAGLHSDVIDGGLVLRDGYVLPPDRPGLGIALTDEIKRRYPFKPGSGEFNSVPGKILTD